MASITIDDKEYNVDNLEDEDKATYASIIFAQNEIARLNNQIALFKTAEIKYAQNLKESLEKK